MSKAGLVFGRAEWLAARVRAGAPRRRWAISTAALVGFGGLTGVLGASAAGQVGSNSTIYVADSASHAVTPIDVATGLTAPLIRLGSLSPEALAVAPGGRSVYVVAVGSDEDGSPGSVIPIPTATDAPGTAIAVGTDAQAIAITPNGKTAYVLNGIDAATTPETTPVTVTPIDLATDAAQHPIDVGTLPLSMTMSPNGKLLYVIDSSPSDPGEPSAITPVDTETNTVGPQIDLARGQAAFPVSGLVFTANGATAYAISPSGIVPINTATGTPTKPIGLRTAMPVALAVTPDNSAIVEVGVPVTAREQGSPYANNVTLALLSTATGVVGKVVTLGDEPGAISWSVTLAPNGSTAYVLVITSSPRQSTVIPVDLATGTAGTPIEVGRNAATLTMSPNGETAYVLDGGTYDGSGSPHNTPGSVIPIVTATGRLGKAFIVGLGAAALAIASAPTVQAQNLIATAAVKRQLVAAFAAGWHLRASEVAGTYPGSVSYGYDVTSRTYWAVGTFVPAKGDPPAIMQDAGAFGVFSRTASGPWKFLGSSTPIVCEELSVVPKGVLAVWNVVPSDAKYCPS